MGLGRGLEAALEKRAAMLEKKRQKELERLEAKKKIEEKKRIERKKRFKKIQNDKYNAKMKKKRLEEREKNGDERAYHMVVLMLNKVRTKRLAASWWKLDAYEKYSELIEKNQRETIFPRVVTNKKNKSKEIEYEIMLVQRNEKGKGDNTVKLKNKDGKFVENKISDNENYKIIAKHEWLVEETFPVYGFHPSKEPKDAHYILDNMLLNDLSRDTIRRVFLYNDKIVIQYDTDFDFVYCKSNSEADRLYMALEKAVTRLKKNKYILFTGDIKGTQNTWVLNEIEKKTGWERHSI